MNVGELMDVLRKLPDDMEVILQKDSEGNGYSPLSGANWGAIYVPDSTWSGDVYCTEHTAEDNDMDEGLWDAMLRNADRALVLSPVN